MPYSLEKRLRLLAQVSNLMLAGSMYAYKNANDNRTITERRNIA